MIHRYHKLLLTERELDMICKMKNVDFVHLKNLDYLVQNIPNSCDHLQVFIMERYINFRPDDVAFSYSWPSFWSSSTILEHLELPLANIKLHNIEKFVNTSKLQKLTFKGRPSTNYATSGKLPSFFFDGSMKKLIIFECICCGLIGELPFISNMSKLEKIDLRANTYLNGTLDSSFYQTPTSLRILRLGETNLTGHIDLPIHDLRNFKCIDVKEDYSLLPLNTTKLYHVNGELWLPGKVANLNYLLRNHQQNISQSYILYEDWILNAELGKEMDHLTNVLQTTWLVNNLICKDYVESNDKSTVICLKKHVVKNILCGENLVLTKSLLRL